MDSLNEKQAVECLADIATWLEHIEQALTRIDASLGDIHAAVAFGGSPLTSARRRLAKWIAP